MNLSRFTLSKSYIKDVPTTLWRFKACSSRRAEVLFDRQLVICVAGARKVHFTIIGNSPKLLNRRCCTPFAALVFIGATRVERSNPVCLVASSQGPHNLFWGSSRRAGGSRGFGRLSLTPPPACVLRPRTLCSFASVPTSSSGPHFFLRRSASMNNAQSVSGSHILHLTQPPLPFLVRLLFRETAGKDMGAPAPPSATSSNPYGGNYSSEEHKSGK